MTWLLRRSGLTGLLSGVLATPRIWALVSPCRTQILLNFRHELTSAMHSSPTELAVPCSAQCPSSWGPAFRTMVSLYGLLASMLQGGCWTGTAGLRQGGIAVPSGWHLLCQGSTVRDSILVSGLVSDGLGLTSCGNPTHLNLTGH